MPTIEPGDVIVEECGERLRVVAVTYRPVMRYYHLDVCDEHMERPRADQLGGLNYIHCLGDRWFHGMRRYVWGTDGVRRYLPGEHEIWIEKHTPPMPTHPAPPGQLALWEGATD